MFNLLSRTPSIVANCLCHDTRMRVMTRAYARGIGGRVMQSVKDWFLSRVATLISRRIIACVLRKNGECELLRGVRRVRVTAKRDDNRAALRHRSRSRIDRSSISSHRVGIADRSRSRLKVLRTPEYSTSIPVRISPIRERYIVAIAKSWKSDKKFL